MKTNERAKKIEQAIRLIWSSLDSHLAWTYEKGPKVKYFGKKVFHKRAVKEYAEIIKILTELY